MRGLHTLLGPWLSDTRSAVRFVRRRWLAAGVFSLAVSVVAWTAFPHLHGLEADVLGMWCRSRPERRPDPRIVLVGITRDAIEQYEEDRPSDCGCRLLSREDIGDLVARLKGPSGASVVGLDLEFATPCGHEGHDATLARALSLRGDTAWIEHLEQTPDRIYFEPTTKAVLPNSEVEVEATSALYARVGGMAWALPTIQIGVPKQDEEADPSVERLGLQRSPFALSVCLMAEGRPFDYALRVAKDRVVCSSLLIPTWPPDTDPQEEPLLTPEPGEAGSFPMLINWVGPVGSFPMYSFTDISNWDDDQFAERLGGRIVLVGSAAEIEATPMTGPPIRPGPEYLDQAGEDGMTGLELHANILDTLLTKRFWRPVPGSALIALLFAVSFATTVLFRAFSTPRALIALLVGVLALGLVARWAACSDTWVFTVTPYLAIALSASVSAVWGFARARQRWQDLAQQLQVIDAATSTVVHDLKQPLAAIEALAAVLRQLQAKGQLDAPPEVLEKIQGQVQRALGDIDSLLTTDPDREIRPQRERFDLAEITRDLAMAQGLTSPDHEIEVRAPEEGAWVHADPRLAARIISNLIDNAIKYWPGGGTVLVAFATSPTDVTVRVIDHGMGIPKEKQASVFNRFERAVTEAAGIPGTGVGLYSVKRLVEAHGGSMTLDSEPGVGSTFTVVLPTQTEPDGALAKE